MNRILIFDTTHHAMWAEELAKEQGLPVEVIPAPEDVDAKCGMALEVLAEAFDNLQTILQQEGVPFKVYQ
jgi:hypothetical protein